jgi:hypothetical protein
LTWCGGRAGGDLLLRHGDTEAEVSFANSLLGGIFFYSRSTFPQQMPKDARLHWAAFFGDVEHEVLEVWAGMRLTLTYTLHREAAAQGSSSGSSSTANPLLLRAGQLHDALAAALGDKKFMKDGGTLVSRACYWLLAFVCGATCLLFWCSVVDVPSEGVLTTWVPLPIDAGCLHFCKHAAPQLAV